MTWEQKEHSQEWLLYPDNVGEHVCIDETSLCDGEIYTFVTNGLARTQKGSLIAVIKGVKAKEITLILKKLPLEKRNAVKEVSVDMANNMEKTARDCFGKASIVTDRFHVAKLIGEAVQSVRIKHRWAAIDEENKKIKECRRRNQRYVANVYGNGDTKKQLLARSRYLLFKPKSKWTASQKARGELLFSAFPEIESSYKLSMMFRNIYESKSTKAEAKAAYFVWRNKTLEYDLEPFQTAADSIESHHETVLNFFDNRTTNALAETFNSKIKAFRSVFRGIRDISFFLYRVSLLFA